MLKKEAEKLQKMKEALGNLHGFT